MAAADIARGNNVVPPTPDAIMEYFLLKEFPGWTLDYVRSLSTRDFQILTRISTTMNKVEASIHEQEMKKAKSTNKHRRTS